MLRLAVSSPPGDCSGAIVDQAYGCWSDCQGFVRVGVGINNDGEGQACWCERAEQSTIDKE